MSDIICICGNEFSPTDREIDMIIKGITVCCKKCSPQGYLSINIKNMLDRKIHIICESPQEHEILMEAITPFGIVWNSGNKPSEIGYYKNDNIYGMGEYSYKLFRGNSVWYQSRMYIYMKDIIIKNPAEIL